MTPPGLLRAGNSLKCCYLRRSLSLERREAHPTALQDRAEVAVKPWQCFGNRAANSIHGAGREAQSSLYEAAEMVACPKGLLDPQTLLLSPGRDPPLSPVAPIYAPPAAPAAVPQVPAFTFLSGSVREAVWDIFPLRSRR